MVDPLSLLDVANYRRQEMLKQAEAERLYRQLKGNRPSLLQVAIRRLRDAGRVLTAPGQARPEAACLGKS